MLGEQLPRERAVPATAVAINASLVVLATGDTDNERRTTAQIADRMEASVLAVPPAAAVDEANSEPGPDAPSSQQADGTPSSPVSPPAGARTVEGP